MANLVVLSDRNVLGYLSSHGIYPAEFYTDLNTFRERSIFFEDTCVLYISFLSGRFSQKILRETLKTLISRAEDKEDNGISKVLLLSMVNLKEFDNYYLFSGSLNSLKEMKEAREKGSTSIQKLLSGCVYNIKDTSVYLSEVDYGINKDALDKVRNAAENKDPILDLVKVPKLEDL